MKNFKHIISIQDLSKEDIYFILEYAEKFEKKIHKEDLKGKIIGVAFYEASTRTRLSFESAAHRLGASVIGFSDAGSSSVRKGESLKDTVKTMESYCDLLVLRHPQEGASRFASQLCSIPVINAGDGSNQHPTQTLLDLYSLKKTQGTLEKLNLTFAGDLKYGRTVHSLVLALARFNASFSFVSPSELQMPKEILEDLDKAGVKYELKQSLKEALKDTDVLYMTRVQKERFTDPIEYERVKGRYILTKAHLKDTKKNFRVFHPLPRVNEIDIEVDESDKAYYFQQAQNGVYVRQALLTLLLEERK